MCAAEVPHLQAADGVALHGVVALAGHGSQHREDLVGEELEQHAGNHVHPGGQLIGDAVEQVEEACKHMQKGCSFAQLKLQTAVSAAESNNGIQVLAAL